MGLREIDCVFSGGKKGGQGIVPVVVYIKKIEKYSAISSDDHYSRFSSFYSSRQV